MRVTKLYFMGYVDDVALEILMEFRCVALFISQGSGVGDDSTLVKHWSRLWAMGVFPMEN